MKKSEKGRAKEVETEKVTMLNGAQTQSLISIMAQFTTGTITEGQAINLISTAIGVDKAAAGAILRGE